MNCSDAVFSNDYYDFIEAFDRGYFSTGKTECEITVNPNYRISFWERSKLPSLNVTDYTYSAIPKCYGLMDTGALEASGILRIRNQPTLSLYGSGVLLGFVDTGIDYTNPWFRYSDGTSRILQIWDQTDSTGASPDSFFFGSEYNKEIIDLALTNETPYNIVPEKDEIGHGTNLAAIAAGNIDDLSGFSGAAPYAGIAVVKLKTAKQYLKDYYFIPDETPAYEESDLMMAVSYLDETAQRLNMPMVICIGLGTNMGDHTGSSPLCGLLDYVNDKSGRLVVVPSGNEEGNRHHYKGILSSSLQYDSVEIRVEEGCDGFTMELWSISPDIYSIEIVSPTGEVVPHIPVGRGSSGIYDFIFADTKIYVDYRIIERRKGDQLIFTRFEKPLAGLWNIRVYKEADLSSNSSSISNQPYHLWLPLYTFLSADVFFIRSDPSTTLTEPGCSSSPLTVASYDTISNSLYVKSGWGYTRDNRVKPDLTAPINVYVPGLTTNGTCLSAALTAGAAALFFEWGIVKGKEPSMNGTFIKNNLIRGANRSDSRTYPNEQWGYGVLDLYGAFQSISQTGS